MAILPPPVPMRSPVLEPGPEDPSKKNPFLAKLHRTIVRFLNDLRGYVATVSSIVGSTSISAGSAAVTTTDIPTPALEEGLYRASYNLRVNRAASTSSSVGMTFGWTAGGVSCSQVFAFLTGNTTASQTSDSILISVDDSTPVVYAISYTSVGGVSMTFDANIVLEVIPT